MRCVSAGSVRRTRVGLAWTSIVGALILGSCREGVLEPVVVGAVEVAGGGAPVRLGQSVQLQVALKSPEGFALPTTGVSWTSSDASVATVSAAGQVTAVKRGTATITASAFGVSGTATVPVIGVQSLVVTPETLTVIVTQTRPLTATVVTDAGVTVTPTWRSLDTALVAVDGTGRVTARSTVGAARVEVTAEDKRDTAVVRVVPVPVARVTVTPDTVAVVAGGTTPLTVATLDSVGGALTGRAVTWASSDTTIATVAPSGLVTTAAYSGGLTRVVRVTATSEGKADTTRVAVTPVAVGTVTLTGAPTDSVLLTTGTIQLTPVLRSSAGTILTGRTVTWTSSATTVAAVDSTGRVTPGTAGPVVITATAEGKSAAVTLQVRAPVIVPPPTATEPVTTTVLNGAVRLTVPPGATTATALTVGAPATAPTDTRVLPGSAYVFGPAGTTFVTPVTVALRFNPAAVPVAKQGKLRIALVEATGLTEVPGGSVDFTNSLVLAPVPHFSTYAILVPPDPASVAVSAGNAQEALVGAAVAVAPAVVVRDAQGRPVPRADVRFRVRDGGGALSDTLPVATDAAGVATLAATWTLGASAGPNTLTAAVVGTSLTVTVTATAKPLPVASVSVTPDTLRLLLGQVGQLTAVPKASDGSTLTGRTATWTILDSAVARITATGVVAARMVGTTVATAMVEGKSGSTIVRVLPTPVGYIEVTPASSSVMQGQTIQLAAVVKDSTGAVLTGRVISWTVSDTAKATVTASGLVTTKAPGAVTVTATSEGRTGTATVTVLAPVATVGMIPDTLTLFTGQVGQLAAVLKAADGTTLSGRTVTWSLADTTIARITATGLVTARKAGTTAATATSEGKTGTALVRVLPPPVGLVEVTPTNPTVGLQRTLQLTAQVKDSTGAVLTGRAVSWASADTTVAMVNGTGVVTGRALGSAVITATSEARTGATVVTVATVAVQSVTVTPATSTLIGGQTVQLSAVVKDAEGIMLSDRAVVWTSSDTAVATVSGAGLVTANGSGGSATITATSEGKSGTATILVAGGPVATITLSSPSLSLRVGTTATLTPVTKDATGAIVTGRTVTWASSDTLIAKVTSLASGNGFVEARGVGTATITATAEGKLASATMTVTAAATNPLSTIAGVVAEWSGNRTNPSRTTLVRLQAVTGTNEVSAGVTQQQDPSNGNVWIDVPRNVLVYVARRYNRDVLFVSAITGANLRELVRADSNQSIMRPSLSPDGTKVAYYRSEGNYTGSYLAVRALDGSGGETRLATTSSGNSYWPGRAPQWSPDGAMVAFTVQASGGVLGTVDQVYTVSATGTGLRALSTEVNVSTSSPTWSPDGVWLGYLRRTSGGAGSMYGGGTGELWKAKAADGSGAVRVTTPRMISNPHWAPNGQAFLHVCGDSSGLSERTCATTVDGATSVEWNTRSFQQVRQWMEVSLASVPAALTGGELRGRVVDATDTTRGVAGAQVRVSVRGGGVVGSDSYNNTYTVLTDGNGNWVSTGLLPDTFDIRTTLTGYTTDSAKTLVVLNAQTLTVPTLKIRNLTSGLRASDQPAGDEVALSGRSSRPAKAAASPSLGDKGEVIGRPSERQLPLRRPRILGYLSGLKTR